MKTIKISNALLINEGKSFEADVLIKGQRIEKITAAGSQIPADKIIDASGLWLVPGVIDDQVHFREPGLTHKATIASESRAAVAGGTTTFMEMPNTNPQTTNQMEMDHKFAVAAEVSPANHSFFFGATNDNLEEVLALNDPRVCGVKVFMGSSTGNMLVDNETVLSNLFSKCDRLIATHCEDEATIRKNMEMAKEKWNGKIPVSEHPIIRNHEACYISSSMAVSLAKKYNTRLHILHISTAMEVDLFEKGPLENKKITSEACVHHLWFDQSMYQSLGSKIQCNPAIKSKEDQKGIWEGLLNNQIDIIATDHAPHTFEEKNKDYPNSPSGLPLVQHSLQMMLEKAQQGVISKERVVEKMCHAPAQCFGIQDRGFIREGYYADLVLVNPNLTYKVSPQNILYKCEWSPLNGFEFKTSIVQTFVNGVSVFENNTVQAIAAGMPLAFHNR
jgi:dihydroorotase